MATIRTGLIGAGVFAGFHAQKAVASESADFIGVHDLSASAAAALIDKVGTGSVFDSVDALLDQCEAVMIATPATTHADLAGRALSAGKHVYVEKPLALTGRRAHELAAVASEKGVILQVGHQERFVFRAMGLLGAPERPLRIEAVREAPRSPQGRCEDVSVVFDLMVHDIDLANALFGVEGRLTSAAGRSAHTALLDEATATFDYGGAEAVIRASRCAPERKRIMTAAFPSGSIEIDFLQRTVRNSTAFDVRLDVSDVLPDPLMAADDAFFKAALGEGDNPVPGIDGARAAALAEAVEVAAKALA